LRSEEPATHASRSIASLARPERLIGACHAIRRRGAGVNACHPVCAGSSRKGVNILDDCDPATFNAAIGPGACVGSGGMRFDLFVALLQKSGVAGPWHFAPNNTSARVGGTLVATNRGGEEHTFTEVAEFGGGVVPFLNDLAHTPEVAPECNTLEDDDMVPPGGQYTEKIDKTGTVKFQCCIRPWMRFEAHVSK